MWIKAAFCADCQVDTNKDRLVSLNEFLAATQKEEFHEKEEWEVGLPSLLSPLYFNAVTTP